MKTLVDRRVWFYSFTVGICVATAVQAQTSTYYPKVDRAGRWEFGLQLRYADDWQVDGARGSQADIDSGIGWGFFVGYNFNQHWNLSGEFTGYSPDYSATVVPQDPNEQPIIIDHELDAASTFLNLTYHVFADKLTPYITGGLGWTYIDSNIATGPGYTSCWWDPWWGYTCSTYRDSYDDNAFSYHLGVGLRWEIISNLFARSSVGQQWMDVDDAKNTVDMTVFRLELGWMY